MPNILKALDFDYLLIEHYKKLNISEDELAVILVLNHLLKQHNDIITAEDLSFKMNLDAQKIDEILSILVKKNIVNLDFDRSRAKLSLNPLKVKLFNQYKMDILHAEETQKEEIANQVQNIYAILEKELKRTLSPIEVSRIQEWFTMNYVEDDIVNAIKDLIATNKKITIKAIDKKLLAKAKAEEINKEGVTALSDNWSKSLEETIKLAKTKWLDTDD
ncbi:MAG: DnaD domain protein [Erysipelotrichales bacterium]|nr:DnaD domain protein [Erysipelotrichales bacterium]